MKFKEARKAIARCAVIGLVSVVATTMMTACSFSFMPEILEDQTYLSDDYEMNETTELFVEMVSDVVDNTDFTNEEEVEEMSHFVDVIANEYAETENMEFQRASLVRVVDGDTIVVNLEDGEYTVRLIGINTPESVASEEYLQATGKENTEEGVAASAYLKDLLSETDCVYLQRDTSNTDKYGRLLRYVWLEVPEGEIDLDDISTKMLNGYLVEQKIAEPAVYEPDTMYAEEFEELYNG